MVPVSKRVSVSLRAEHLAISGNTMGGIGMEMNGEKILKELEAVLLRYRAGLLTEDRATKEISILQAMLRAHDQVTLERKLDVLQAALETRR